MHEWELVKRSIADYSELIRLLPRERRCFHVHGSFGDVYLQCAALKERIEEHGPVSVIIDSKYKQLIAHGLGEDAFVVYADGNAVNSIFHSIGVHSSRGFVPTRMLPTVYPFITECVLSGRLKYSDFLRVLVGSDKNGVFPGLEENLMLGDEASNILEEAGVPIGRTVLMCADNNTQTELPETFWLRVIASINRLGLTPCLNDSGNLRSEGAKLLSGTDLKRIKVPPHLAVTLASYAGTYITGNNGFATIQALFNHQTRGIHFINDFVMKDNMIPDKSGNEIPCKTFFHETVFGTAITGLQIEELASPSNDDLRLDNLIGSVFDRR